MSTTNDADLLEDGLTLAPSELGLLQKMLGHGDRAGFYATYNAITSHLDDTAASGAHEAALQITVATLSDDVGGVAFYSNALLQEALGTTAYGGIYYLSQQVAESAMEFMKAASPADGQTGKLLSEKLFFSSAIKAWSDEGEVDHFLPGDNWTQPELIGGLV